MNTIYFKSTYLTFSTAKRWVVIFICLFGLGKAVAQTYPTGFSQTVVVSGLSSPTAFDFAPDGRLFIAQQGGALRVVKNGVLLPTPFVQLSVDPQGERGLVGVTLDPDFATNHYVYVYYTTATGIQRNIISRFTADGDVALAGSETLILALDPLSGATNHNGGALHFGQDGKLYIAVGDNSNGATPQDLDSYFGKILRIEPDGSAPADNPFPTGSEQRKRVWGYGLRNPYTFSVDPASNRIFVNDVGQSTWEEVNDASVGGRNFGWPIAEGESADLAFTNPVYTYPHGPGDGLGCAITGGTFFSPTATNYPAGYQGNYFLIDFCNQWINTLDLTTTPATRSPFASNIFGPAGNMVNLTTGPDGNLYFLRLDTGALYKVVYNANMTAFALAAPTVNCTTGAFTFNSTGGDGTLIEYRAIGITDWSSNPNQAVDAGLLTTNDPVAPFTLYARQNGIETRPFSFDLRLTCPLGGTVITPPATNSAPVAPAVGPQLAVAGVGYTFTVPAFTDPNNDLLTYSINGLPTGLDFDAGTRIISGLTTATGVSTVTVAATDPGSLSASVQFTLTVSPVSSTTTTPPTAVSALTLLTPTVNCQTGSFVFNRIGGNGTPIEFRAAPGITDWSFASIYFIDSNLLTAADATGIIMLQARQSGVEATPIPFNLRATCPLNGTVTQPAANSAPVAVAVGPQSATVGQSFSVTIPIFSDPNGDALTYSATGLPVNGLAFNGNTRTISGTPSTTGAITVTITATDPGLLSAQTSFVITVSPASSTTTTPPQPPSGVFSLVAPTYNCATGAFTFNTTGGDGSPVEFLAIGITNWTQTAGPYTVLPASDAKPFTLKARYVGQPASEVTYTWDFRVACSGPPAPNAAPVAVAVGPQSATVGQFFSVTIPTFSDPNGDALTYSATGLPVNGLTFNGNTRIISGTPSTTGTINVTITATDPGLLSAHTSFVITIAPPNSTTVTPPVSPTTSVCGSSAATVGQPFMLVAPSFDCTTRALTFNTTGGDGSPIIYWGVGIVGRTNTNCTVTIDAGNADSNTYTLRAIQNGQEITYTWMRPCYSSRQGVESVGELNLTVLGNPTATKQVEIEVRGAEGQPVQVRLLSANGLTVSELSVEAASAIERQTVNLGPDAGLYLLNVSTPTQRKTVKVVRQ